LQTSTTVIITAAGLGSRLNLKIPKSLVEINGKSILRRQLEILDEYDDIRIVVGYHADRVIDHVKNIRKDILFVFNHNYVNSTPLNSLYLASRFARKKILYIDGDLLITPKALANITKSGKTNLGITKTYSDHPVCVEIEKRNKESFITKFSRKRMTYEWSGLMYADTNMIIDKSLYVYQIFENYLPLNATFVDVCEIDTQKDLEFAKKWIKRKS